MNECAEFETWMCTSQQTKLYVVSVYSHGSFKLP